MLPAGTGGVCARIPFREDEKGFDADAQGVRRVEEMQKESRASQFQAFLKKSVADETKRVYAVLDGMQIKNVGTKLQIVETDLGYGLAHVPLAQDQDGNGIPGGPWLVSPYVYKISPDRRDGPLSERPVPPKDVVCHEKSCRPVDRLEALFDLLDDMKAAAFWIGDASLAPIRLFAHLIGLDAVLTETPDEADSGLQSMPFRHADANTLAEAVPELDSSQLVRLLGPAQMLLALPREGWSEREIVAVRPDPAPGSAVSCDPGKPLFFDARTMEAMNKRRMKGFEHVICEELHKVDPGSATALSQEDLRALVARSMEDAQRYGIKTESGCFRWAFMSLQTKEQFYKRPEVQAFMTSNDDECRLLTPDERTRVLMDAVIAQMERLRDAQQEKRREED